jgi:hypothetical protein
LRHGSHQQRRSNQKSRNAKKTAHKTEFLHRILKTNKVTNSFSLGGFAKPLTNAWPALQEQVQYRSAVNELRRFDASSACPCCASTGGIEGADGRKYQ